MGPNTGLSTKQLSLKLAMLMALTSASRGSELAKLNPQLMTDSGDQIIFHIAGLTKTKRPNKPHLSFIFHTYTDDETLDVIQCLREYLRRTEPFRSSEAQKQKLFLGYTKPHKPVVTCSIARLRTVMSIAGIDTSIFKAHSTRARHPHQKR